MTNDRFWKSFWLLFAGAALLCAGLSASLLFIHVNRIDTAQLGIDYTPGKDPFATGVRQSKVTAVTGGYIFRDVLPLGLSSWTWDASADLHASAETAGGGSAIKMLVTKPWGGLGIGGFKVSVSANKTLMLEVYPDAAVGDLYLQLYDAKGDPLALQSLGWYAPGGVLQANQWQSLSIPVQNLLGSSTASSVTALSINTTNPGIAYVDSIAFSGTPSSHDAWVYQAPAGYVAPPFNPFATSTAVSLPYTLSFSPYWNDQWYSPRGFFEQDYNEFKLGPQKGDADALAYLRGGRLWSDYEVSASVYWGSASVFALVVRMQDEGTYASCSFSASGDTVQMYLVKDGVSTMVAQSDKLHYGDYSGGIVGAGASVHGNNLICSLDGKQELNQQVDGIAPDGTVGMEAWDKDDSTSAHQIQSFQVHALVGE